MRLPVRAIAPVLLGLTVFGVHAWSLMYGAEDAAASRWVALETPRLGQRLSSYWSGGGLWLGYCYGVAAGFALWSVMRWIGERRSATAAAGGVTLSGVIAGAACFMTGCCGSPMLGVWIGIFGAASAPFLGPLAALITTVSVAMVVRGGMRKVRQGANCECSCDNVKDMRKAGKC